MFVNDTSYKYVVTRSDNYLILTDVPSASGNYQNPDTINTFTQYIYPSTLCFEGTQDITGTRYFESINVTDSFWERADSVFIFFGGFLITFIFVFIFNIFSKLVRPGGIL